MNSGDRNLFVSVVNQDFPTPYNSFHTIFFLIVKTTISSLSFLLFKYIIFSLPFFKSLTKKCCLRFTDRIVFLQLLYFQLVSPTVHKTNVVIFHFLFYNSVFYTYTQQKEKNMSPAQGIFVHTDKLRQYCQLQGDKNLLKIHECQSKYALDQW